MNPRRSFFAIGLATLATSLVRGHSADLPVRVPAEFTDLLLRLPPLHTCRVAAAHPVLFGAVPIVLAGPSGLFQVDLCRRSDVARGVAQSRSFDLFVHNGGDGRKATTREQILAVRALAAELDAREGAGCEMPMLLSWEERRLQAGGRALSVIDDGPSSGSNA
ncbi:MAG TPA: hypothetical protein VG937_10390 [Polyangiaceae bacterium]|nr:hypothetical protein [Polyangiaceae bacterium]